MRGQVLFLEVGRVVVLLALAMVDVETLILVTDGCAYLVSDGIVAVLG